MYRKLVFQAGWRLAVSVIPPFLLIGGLIVNHAVNSSRSDLERYSREIRANETHCAEAVAKGLLEKDITKNSGGSQLLLPKSECEKPKEPTGFFGFVLADLLDDGFLALFASSASIFLILTSISLYISEKIAGWKRLSIVVASALGLVSFLVPPIFESSYGGAEHAVIALLNAGAAFLIGVLLVLGGRLTAKWVQAGFTDPAETINQSLPEPNSNYTSPGENSAPHHTSISTGRLLASKSGWKKIFATTGAIIAVIIAIVIAKVTGKVVSEVTFGPKHVEFSDSMLESAANEVNKRLPMMLDKETRWDTTRSESGLKYTNYYTLVNNSSDSVDPLQLQAVLGPSLKNLTCSNKQLKTILESGGVINYGASGFPVDRLKG